MCNCYKTEVPIKVFSLFIFAYDILSFKVACEKMNCTDYIFTVLVAQEKNRGTTRVYPTTLQTNITKIGIILGEGKYLDT